MPTTHTSPSYKEALAVWVKVAINSFGGPAGQIAVMHRLLVEEKKWISENSFLHALNYCMLLPGPEAQQLATYIGWLLHRNKGGLTAGLLFVLPGFLSILLLSIIYVTLGNTLLVQGFFYGIKPAVLAIVVGAVIRIGKKALKNNAMRGIALAAFLGVFLFNLPFPIIVLAAGICGYVGGIFREDLFFVIKGHDVSTDENALIRPSLWRSFGTAGMWLLIWMTPVALVHFWLGGDHILSKLSVFFSEAAVVTFGGAYSVLSYIAQEAVHQYGWLSAGEMLDGLGMAETTPGPLIQVVQFVGFVGAYRAAAPFTPLVAALLASLLVTWVTYAPSFLYIFTGAPYIEYLRGSKRLSSALSGITSAVVGVILNLAIWFGLHVVFAKVDTIQLGALHISFPDWHSIQIVPLLLTLLALLLYFPLKRSMFQTIFICALLGVVYFFFR